MVVRSVNIKQILKIILDQRETLQGKIFGSSDEAISKDEAHFEGFDKLFYKKKKQKQKN